MSSGGFSARAQSAAAHNTAAAGQTGQNSGSQGNTNNSSTGGKK